MGTDESIFFREATLNIFSSLDIDTAFENTRKFLKQFMPIDGLTLTAFDTQRNIHWVLAAKRPEEWPCLQERIAFPSILHNWIKKEYHKRKKLVMINDISKESFIERQLLRFMAPSDSSLLNMDLKLDGFFLGMLIVQAEGKHQYSEEHLHLLSLLRDPFTVAISNALKHQEIVRLKEMLEEENGYSSGQTISSSDSVIVGANFGLSSVTQQVHEVSGVNCPILLRGETGVGKEVVANAIHEESGRCDKPFITVNCGAIPENLVDSELFGHEKGAFTGAVSRKRGRFERAHEGTIFLDEIGELPLHAQVRLLRVFQDQVIERVGGTESIPLDVRIIAATHRNLEEMVQQGTFREDLWFRLNVFPINIPPLRERPDDIHSLVNHFIDRKCMEMKIHEEYLLAPGALEKLLAHDWPGNVRELGNAVERAIIRAKARPEDKFLRFDSLAPSPQSPSPSNDTGRILSLDEANASHILKALQHTNGKVEGPDGAAALLGVNPSTLRGKMRKLGVNYKK